MNGLVVKFASSVGVEVDDGIQGIGYGIEGFMDEGGITKIITGVANDLTVKEVGNNTNIGPSVVYTNVG